MKPIRLTTHAREQARERGASLLEVETAVRKGIREPAKKNREMCRFNLPFDAYWGGRRYAVKQVAPIIREDENEIVGVTVFTFYF